MGLLDYHNLSSMTWIVLIGYNLGYVCFSWQIISWIIKSAAGNKALSHTEQVCPCWLVLITSCDQHTASSAGRIFAVSGRNIVVKHERLLRVARWSNQSSLRTVHVRKRNARLLKEKKMVESPCHVGSRRARGTCMLTRPPASECLIWSSIGGCFLILR